MGACASVSKAVRGKFSDDKAPLPEVKVDEEVKVDGDQSAVKEQKEEEKTTPEVEELPKSVPVPASAAEEAEKTADSTVEVKEQK